MKATTGRNQRKTKSMARARKSPSHIGGKVVIGKKANKRSDAAVTMGYMTSTLDKKLKHLVEMAKGRIQYIPASNDEVAHIIVPPDVDEEIRKTIHLSDFLPSHTPQ